MWKWSAGGAIIAYKNILDEVDLMNKCERAMIVS